MKTMKFQPGTFLEIDDLNGGRKVVLVGKDGVTFWDSLKNDDVTPVVIHPVLNPVDLGTLALFIKAKGVELAAHKLLESMKARMDDRANDALYLMRAIWSLAAKATSNAWLPTDSEMVDALQQAQLQESAALRVHEYAEKFVRVHAAAA